MQKGLWIFAVLLALVAAQSAMAADSELMTEDEITLGPWLDLYNGGISEGAAQGKNGAIGKLVNALPIAKSGLGYRRLTSEAEAYGAGHMISLLESAAADLTTNIWPGMTLAFGDISRQDGGPYQPHKSHQNGLDVDVLFVGNQNWRSVLDQDGAITDRFDPEMNWQLWRKIFDQKIVVNGKPTSVVSMILVAPEIKEFLCVWAKDNRYLDDPENYQMMTRIRATAGHDDHFHLRIHCSPHHPLCVREGNYRDLGCSAP